MGKGFKMYYEELQTTVTAACQGKIVYATGHSLGAAAADIMHAYGEQPAHSSRTPGPCLTPMSCAARTLAVLPAICHFPG